MYANRNRFDQREDRAVSFQLTVAGFFDSAKMYVDSQPDDVPVSDAKEGQKRSGELR